MKTVTAGIVQHLEQEVTTLATMWRVTLTNGTVLGFTDNVTDLTFEGLRYASATGYTPTTVETNSTLGVDDLELMGILESPAITEADLMAGVWDYARVELFKVNYRDLSQGAIKLRVGWTGEVLVRGSGFVTELRGLAQRLQLTVGRNVMASCNADFGDSRCTFDRETVTVTGEVTAIVDRRIFHGDVLPTRPDGEITWLTGANANRRMEVKVTDHVNLTFALLLPMAHDIAIGDTYSVYAGCDKLKETCKDTFNNLINFRGFPFVPQTDEVVRGPAR